MGRATNLAVGLKNSGNRSGEDLLNMVANTNRVYRHGYRRNEHDEPDGMRSPSLTRDGLWGSVVVKDRDDNNHRIIYAGTEQSRQLESGQYRHTEEMLNDDLIDFLEHHNMELMSARVIFFMRWSPCTRCTKKLVEWAWGIGTRLTPNGNCIVKFVYQELYSKTNCGYQLTYSNNKTAGEAYKNIIGTYTPKGNGGSPRVKIEIVQR